MEGGGVSRLQDILAENDPTPTLETDYTLPCARAPTRTWRKRVAKATALVRCRLVGIPSSVMTVTSALIALWVRIAIPVSATSSVRIGTGTTLIGVLVTVYAWTAATCTLRIHNRTLVTVTAILGVWSLHRILTLAFIVGRLTRWLSKTGIRAQVASRQTPHSAH